MSTLDEILSKRLDALEAKHLKRTIVTTTRLKDTSVERVGGQLISFSDNDYLGLAAATPVVDAAQKALEKDGVGARASRLVTGNHPHYDLLERTLAHYKNTQAACVFGSGYLANIGVVTALLGKDDLIVADKYSHACMVDGAQLSGATLKRFSHNDMVHLERLLQKYRASFKQCLIMTETVFSMDGDLAPIDAINALANTYDAWVMSDDAHGLGVVKSPAVDIHIGTLSKAVGGYGGYVCGSQILIDTIKTTARSLIYSTALPPCVVAAANASMALMLREPERAEKALANARLFCDELELATPHSAIVPLIVGSAEAALNASLQLEAQGFLVGAIRPPTVPVGSARLRFAFSANHATSDIQRLTGYIQSAEWYKDSNH